MYASWAFASLLITLRVQVITGILAIWLFLIMTFLFRIAIWNRNIFVTSILMGTWLADLAVYIYSKSRIIHRLGAHELLTCCWTYEALVEVCTFSADRSPNYLTRKR